jgi:hypothetical protein
MQVGHLPPPKTVAILSHPLPQPDLRFAGYIWSALEPILKEAFFWVLR